MRRDPGTGIALREPSAKARVRSALRALQEAERRAYAQSVANGAYGVLEVVQGPEVVVGVHTAVPCGRTHLRPEPPARGVWLEQTVRRFRIAA